MNKSILSLLVRGGLIFSIAVMGQRVQALQLSYPAQINKSFAPFSIDPGEISRLEVTIFNPNTFALMDASWTDNLVAVQPGMFIANPANIENTCGGTVGAAPGATTLTLSGGTVPEQVGADPGSCTVSVDVTSFTPGNLINTLPIGALSSTGSQGPISNTTPASATLHVDVVQAPTLSKSFSPNTILVGQTSQLAIRIRNNDPELTLTQASLTDELPANVVLADPVLASLSNCGGAASLNADPGDTSVSLSNASIPPASTCTIQVNVTSIVSGEYTNTISPGALDTEQGLTNAAAASGLLNVQDIGLSKSFSPASFQAGGTSTLTITLRNPTSSAFTGVELSDTLPGDVLTFLPGSASTTCGGSVSILPPRTVRLTGGTVPAGSPSSPGACTITVQVTAPADASGQIFINTIPPETLVTDQGITNGLGASARVRVYTVGGGLAVNKSFLPDTIRAGENSSLRINITAPGDTALTNFSITDNLPPNVTISNSSPATRNNCGDNSVLIAETNATSITLSNGTIAAGATCQITVYVTSSTAGVHTNVIAPGDITNSENRTIPNNVTADLTVRVASDISMSKSFTPPSVSPGGISTLRIVLQNTNTSPVENVSITDPLPGTATNGIIVAPNPNASTTCAGGSISAAPGTQTISMTSGTIPAQVDDVPGTCTIRVDVQGLGSQTTRTNTIPADNLRGTIGGTTITPEQPASATLAIRDLIIGVVKGFDPLTVFGGSASTLSIELVNPNNVTMDGIAFTDNMPDGMIVANPADPSVGDCGGTLDAPAGANSFSFSGGSLAASTSCTLTVRVTMTVNGNLTNTIESNAVTTLSGASNRDPAEASLTNLPGASITKVFAPNPVRAGSVSTLIFTIQNTGSVSLSGMGFEDELPGDLPVGVAVADSPAAVNNCGGELTAVPGTQAIRLRDGSLDAGASCTITVPVIGNIQGNFTNTINAGSLRSDQGATNHDPTSDTIEVTGGPSGGSGGGGRGRGGGGNDSAAPLPAVSGFLIPVTGFRAGSTTLLDEETRPTYDALDLRIEIPVIKIDTSIVGVQIKDGGWDVAWLQDQAGWLNGTAYPTWNGNSVLTGHVVNADGRPGVFSNLKYLGLGEYIFVYSSGYRFTYQVVSNEEVKPDDVTIFRHKTGSHLTLVTCDTFNESTDTYESRIAVQARLVQVKPIP